MNPWFAALTHSGMKGIGWEAVHRQAGIRMAATTRHGEKSISEMKAKLMNPGMVIEVGQGAFTWMFLCGGIKKLAGEGRNGTWGDAYSPGRTDHRSSGKRMYERNRRKLDNDSLLQS